ncbi:hypothetical protein EDM56_17400 [Brevibacillus fluminis]|uniref:Uncharacterized protein n=1 Tax=Brevibacillus fluminis TaxID=511487 RepID=A0A3M8DIL0_9BACL|nr:hypothetical protein EDM56_17400 [Brevibacillus fluminis]
MNLILIDKYYHSQMFLTILIAYFFVTMLVLFFPILSGYVFVVLLHWNFQGYNKDKYIKEVANRADNR